MKNKNQSHAYLPSTRPCWGHFLIGMVTKEIPQLLLGSLRSLEQPLRPETLMVKLLPGRSPAHDLGMAHYPLCTDDQHCSILSNVRSYRSSLHFLIWKSGCLCRLPCYWSGKRACHSHRTERFDWHWSWYPDSGFLSEFDRACSYQASLCSVRSLYELFRTTACHETRNW